MRFLLAVSYLLLGGLLLSFLMWGQPVGRNEPLPAPADFSQTRAVAHLNRIEALTGTGGRPVGSPSNALVRQYVGRELQKAGLEVYQQVFVDPLGGAIVSIIGQLPGKRGEAVMLCSHHDLEAGVGPFADGAAGLAVMLEVARTSAAAGAKVAEGQGAKRRALLFASWDGESFGCAGSSHFVKTLPARERAKLRAVVSLDSLGGTGAAPAVHVLPYRDRFGIESIAPDWLVLKVSQAARRRGASIPIGDPTLGLGYQILVRAVDVGYYSDDRPFLAEGIPAVFISSFSLTRGASSERTARPVDPETIGSVGRSIEAALANLSSADSLPVGELRYLILQLPGLEAFRLTCDQITTLALVGLLPGSFALIRRPRHGRLRLTRTLFFASATVYVTGVFVNPVLLGVLFGPALLAAPLLVVPRKAAMLGHVASLFFPLLFAALLIPLFVMGAASLVTLTPLDLSSVGGLLTIALVQVVLHGARSRRAPRPPRSSMGIDSVVYAK